jgi:hypothetical protein
MLDGKERHAVGRKGDALVIGERNMKESHISLICVNHSMPDPLSQASRGD